MRELAVRFAGLEALVIGELKSSDLWVVLLHGYGMQAADLSPFAHSLALPGVGFVFPQGPLLLSGGRRAWWPVDEAARSSSMRAGARDLVAESHPGRVAARAALGRLLAELRALYGTRPLLLGGFSQGGMLACDAFLMEGVPVEGLAMLSASRLAAADWDARQSHLSGKRVFVSHGRDDTDLAFAAGERLQAFLRAGGAQVSWVPFEGGHQIPLLVWRKFRSFADEIRKAALARRARHENEVTNGPT